MTPFDVTGAARLVLRRAGTGLTNIADRLAVHAGTLHIRTQPNHGTTVTLQIPTTKPANPQ